MSPRILLALSLSAVAVAMVSAADSCYCSGVDVCECRPSVIRVKQRKLHSGLDSNTCSRCEMPLYSYTDPCSRRRYTVSPAQKQSSRYTPPPPAPETGPCFIQPSATIPFSDDDHDHGQVYNSQEMKPQEQLTSVVDPVSLYLAKKNAKSSCPVDEARMYYGFYKTPNHSVTEEAASIREEALNTIDKRVLVMKNEPKKCKFSVDPDSQEDQEEKPRKPNYSPRLTYNDLGYTTYGQDGRTVKDQGYRQSQGSSSAYIFPPQQSVQRSESRSSHRKSEQSTNHECRYEYHF